MSCNWENCSKISGALLQPSNSTNHSTTENWVKFSPLHSSSMELFVKVDIDGTMELLISDQAAKRDIEGKASHISLSGET